MAKLVDALDSGSSRGNSVEVQLFLAAKKKRCKKAMKVLPFIAFSFFTKSTFYAFATAAGASLDAAPLIFTSHPDCRFGT
jgi:hypothetical protein